jgi:hypothetical protein
MLRLSPGRIEAVFKLMNRRVRRPDSLDAMPAEVVRRMFEANPVPGKCANETCPAYESRRSAFFDSSFCGA